MSNIINVYYVKVDHQGIYTKEEMWHLFIISSKGEVGVPWDQDLQGIKIYSKLVLATIIPPLSCGNFCQNS